ncbi:hypothetical protein COK91_07135 [Bacillus cereus]|nr:hypothetical protein CN440_21865 [Bacillus cereus]PFU83484.1 hypothetical protein COK91_07135 [Bacillus cereus]PFV34832.1 hypothetical protein COL01_10835 [Bacillus thuringiensis]
MMLISGMLCSKDAIELDLKELLKKTRRKGNPLILTLFLKCPTYKTFVSFYYEFYIGFFEED